MTKTLVPLGLMLYLLAGRWNGNHPPAMVRMNDVMFGLTMTSTMLVFNYVFTSAIKLLKKASLTFISFLSNKL